MKKKILKAEIPTLMSIEQGATSDLSLVVL